MLPEGTPTWSHSEHFTRSRLRPVQSVGNMAIHCVFFAALVGTTWAYYLPGISPTNYCVSKAAKDNCQVSTLQDWWARFMMSS